MQRILLWSGIGLIIVVVIVSIVLLVLRRPTKKNGNRPSGEPVTLTMWDPIDSEDVWKPIISQYQQENSNVRIKYVKKSLTEYEIEAINALSAGTGPDIWAVHNSWMVRHRDKLVPAPENILQTSKQDKRRNESIVKNTYVPIVAQEGTFGGQVYGIPMSVDTLVLYANNQLLNRRINELTNQLVHFNQSLFSQGARTWDEFNTLTKLLTKKEGSAITQSAIAMGTAQNNPRAVDFLVALMLQNGAQMESPDQLTATFNLPTQKSTGEAVNPGLNALEFFTSFARADKETYTWNNSFPDALEAFLDNKVVMIPGYSWLGGIIKQRQPEFQYVIFPLPQIFGAQTAIDYGNYWFETVSKNTKNPNEAWQFVRFITTRGLSLYTSATNRPRPLKHQPGELPFNLLARNIQGNPFQFQTATARPWYRGLQPVKVESAMAEMIEDVVSRSVTAENALNKAAKTVTEIFRATTPAPTTNPSNTQQK